MLEDATDYVTSAMLTNTFNHPIVIHNISIDRVSAPWLKVSISVEIVEYLSHRDPVTTGSHCTSSSL